MKKLTNLNQNVTSNKTKHAETEKKVTDLTEKVAKISEKWCDFLLGWVYFTDNDGYQNFLVFPLMLNSLIWDNNKNVTSWILTGISSESIKPFDTNIEPTMSNLGNGKVVLKFNNSVLVQKNFSSMYSNFILNLYILCELNTWPYNPTNNLQ